MQNRINKKKSQETKHLTPRQKTLRQFWMGLQNRASDRGFRLHDSVLDNGHELKKTESKVQYSYRLGENMGYIQIEFTGTEAERNASASQMKTRIQTDSGTNIDLLHRSKLTGRTVFQVKNFVDRGFLSQTTEWPKMQDVFIDAMQSIHRLIQRN